MSQDKEEFKRFNAQTAIELFNDVEKTDLFSAAEKINVPSLVVSAEKDEIAPVGSLEKLAKKIEKGDLEIIKNSGHLVPVEEPAITAELVNKWISRFK
jgi:pimeloyl-ACP methyl ester carboxylesterase